MAEYTLTPCDPPKDRRGTWARGPEYDQLVDDFLASPSFCRRAVVPGKSPECVYIALRKRARRHKVLAVRKDGDDVYMFRRWACVPTVRRAGR